MVRYLVARAKLTRRRSPKSDAALATFGPCYLFTVLPAPYFRKLFDVPTALIASTALGLLMKFKKLQEPLLIVVAGVVGIVLKAVLP